MLPLPLRAQQRGRLGQMQLFQLGSRIGQGLLRLLLRGHRLLLLAQ